MSTKSQMQSKENFFLEGYNTQGPDSHNLCGTKKDQNVLISMNPICVTVTAPVGLLKADEQ